MAQIVYQAFFKLGEAVESRGLGLSGKNTVWEGYSGGARGGVVSGYFNNGDDFTEAVTALDTRWCESRCRPGGALSLYCFTNTSGGASDPSETYGEVAVPFMMASTSAITVGG